MRNNLPNKITGANAGGPRQLPTRTRWAARVAQFCRYGSMRHIIPVLALLFLCGCAESRSTKFLSTFQQAFDTGNTNALLVLVKWDGMPEAFRSGMVWKLTNYLGKQ